MCYRKAPHGGVETTMLVESFHNILKSIYLRRIPNRRIDDLIDLLLQIEEDYFVRYDNAIQLETLSPRDIKKIKERHQRGKKIDDQDVLKVSHSCYQVKSQEKDICDEYKVVRCVEKCDITPCIFMCPTCAICSHMYQCTCPDTTPLCKHIHKVHLMNFIPSASEAISDPLIDQEPEFFVGENIEESLEVTESVAQNPDFTVEKKLERIKDIMKEVENQLENSPVKNFMLSRIQNVLTDLHYQCKALTSDNTKEKPVPEMDKQINICPNEKMQRQVKPFKRVKKTKKKGLQKPNKKSAEEIKKFLFQDDVDDDNAENIDDVCPVILDGGENNQEVPSDEFNIGENDLQELCDETIINKFFKVLATNEALYSCNTSNALLLESTLNKALGNSHSKSTILVPARLSESELSVAALCAKSQELWYFNPLAKPHGSLSRHEMKFLSSLASCGRSVFPTVKKWTIQRHFDPQEDSVNSVVLVCWFGYQICDLGKGPVPLIPNVASCRKEIYDA
ncbi:Bifunctional purine biosynthesis protein PurH, partial [Frankliniella fusca]